MKSTLVAIRVNRLRLGWMDGVEVALDAGRDDDGGCAKDRKEWQSLVHM